MRRKFLFSILLIFAVATSITALKVIQMRFFPYFFTENSFESFEEDPVLYIYDPNGQMKNETAHHFLLKLRAASEWDADTSILSTIPEEEPVLLTIELWGKNILKKIISSELDEKTENLISEIYKKHPNTYLRFLPEMEGNEKAYPWANWGPVYTEAFERLSRIAKKVRGAKVVWGPAGRSGLMEYLPQKEIFDAASVSLDTENTELKKEIWRKIFRMRFTNVPLFIIGSPTHKKTLPASEIDLLFKKLKQEKTEIAFKNDILNTVAFPKRKKPVVFGVYDPDQKFTEHEKIEVEHIFISFKDVQNGDFTNELNDILSRHHDVIITFEPADLPGRKKGDFLTAIPAGEYDPLLKKFYGQLPPTDQNIYLRFAHEMEIPVDRYAWQKKDPVQYIKMFRYFMQFPHDPKVEIKKIWGPAGDRGSANWWPGSDVVDYISISVYGLPDKNITDPTKQESFEKIYHRKLRRIQHFKKPIFITEFGVKGSEEFQETWLQNAANLIKNDKAIYGVNYFNYQDVPKAWGNIKPPDWRISKKTFEKFTEALE